jgi:hypothetical protein
MVDTPTPPNIQTAYFREISVLQLGRVTAITTDSRDFSEFPKDSRGEAASLQFIHSQFTMIFPKLSDAM